MVILLILVEYKSERQASTNTECNLLCFKEMQIQRVQEGSQRQLRFLKIAHSTYKHAVALKNK